jgi:hypothetical protein
LNTWGGVKEEMTLSRRDFTMQGLLH